MSCFTRCFEQTLKKHCEKQYQFDCKTAIFFSFKLLFIKLDQTTCIYGVTSMYFVNGPQKSWLFECFIVCLFFLIVFPFIFVLILRDHCHLIFPFFLFFWFSFFFFGFYCCYNVCITSQSLYF